MYKFCNASDQKCSYPNRENLTNSRITWPEQLCSVQNELYDIYFVNANTGYIVGAFGMVLKTTNGGEAIGIEQIIQEFPQKYSLSQNYPNPFNPNTKIRFDIPPLEGDRGRITQLIVYDILGREVATLVNKQLKSGTYEVDWNGSSCSSGVYFYRLIGNNFTETKKMILIK